MTIRVTIVGTGEHAIALSQLFSNYNIKVNGYILEVTNPGIRSNGNFHHFSGVTFAPLIESLIRADIVIIAIPATSLSTFFIDHIEILKDKILVDTTNPSCNSTNTFCKNHKNEESLPRIIATTTRRSIHDDDNNILYQRLPIRWVKGLNDFTSTDVVEYQNVTSNYTLTTKLCSKYPRALDSVRKFAELSLGLDVKIVPFRHYPKFNYHQNTVSDEWITSVYIILFSFIFTEFYSILR
jgi:hypothetical protein